MHSPLSKKTGRYPLVLLRHNHFSIDGHFSQIAAFLCLWREYYGTYFIQDMKKILVTGSSGLIGSEVCKFFSGKDFAVHGIDNNQRAIFFGEKGDTRYNQRLLQETISNFTHHEIDIRDRQGIIDIFREVKPDAIVHTAAQPSHDLAAVIPFDDFDTNATGTMNLLESARRFCAEAPFIHMSTNKVYGDAPNFIKLKELETRWDYDDPLFEHGISETFTIDQSRHSLFGASKLASDIMVQEYGRYFGMPTCCLRGGCLTGPNHAGVELHGFLSYLVQCNLKDHEYKIFGFKGKQVRDNIHAFDVASFAYEFYNSPRSGEVYNMGGGKANSCSVLEAFKISEKYSGKTQSFEYIDENRKGDHICYYSDLRKIKSHYPSWSITKSLDETIREIVEAWQNK